MADRIGIIRNGRMAQVGAPADIYEHPANRFVADFVGAANVLPCVVRPDGVTADLPALGATVQAAVAGKPGHGWLAVRAERLRLDDAALPNRLDGMLVGHAYAGEALSWTVRLADGTMVRVSQSLPDGLTGAAYQPGARVVLSWHPRASILLSE